ncbi:dienelactone hydrolase family protein [Streptomyces boninensis]|uniref:dienelactone hydrolase family protein n=1 Tax=Streptomyces boninensis TaxID=2039455 RepID=UPI003B21BB16
MRRHRPSPAHRARRRAASLAAAVALTAFGLTQIPGSATAGTPKAAEAIGSVSVPRSGVSGFGGGTIYYPGDTGRHGAVAISPGFLSKQAAVAWLGPRLAEQGFIVFVIDTKSIYDVPASRGDQLLAALDHLTQRSTLKDRVDSGRLAVMGHSMGGGGALEAAKDRPALKAAIPLTGWNTDTTWPEVRTPTLVVGAENDAIAPVASHSEPFYASLPGTTDKAYLELNDADHFAPMTSNATIEKYSVAWLKRFVDGDTGQNAVLCPGPAPGSAVSEYRSTCPY